MGRRAGGDTYLLVLGHRVEQLDVQLGVVLGQRLVAVVVDELHHRAEGQRVREAVLPLPMEDLDQLVVASLPAGRTRMFTVPAAADRVSGDEISSEKLQKVNDNQDLLNVASNWEEMSSAQL